MQCCNCDFFFLGMQPENWLYLVLLHAHSFNFSLHLFLLAYEVMGFIMASACIHPCHHPPTPLLSHTLLHLAGPRFLQDKDSTAISIACSYIWGRGSCIICFSVWLISLNIVISNSIFLKMSWSHFPLSQTKPHCVDVPYLLYPLVTGWTSILIWFLKYNE